MKKSNVVLIIVLATAGVLCVAGMIALFGYFAVKGVSSRPATDAEKELVVDAATLIEYGAEADAKCGEYKMTRNLDATTMISYECDSESLYVLSSAEINPTPRDARQSFVLEIGAYKAGVALGGSDATLHRRDELLGGLGDDRYAAIIQSGGKNAGNILIVRQGRILHSVMITGLYFDDAEPIRELMTPVVEAGKKQR